MRRVVHLTPVHFGEDGTFGGGERYPAELAHAMARYVPTTLVGFGSRRRSFTRGPLKVEVLPVRTRWRGSEVNPLHESLPFVLGRCGVLHLHQWESVTSNVGVLHGRAVGARVFATDHGGSGRNYWRKLRLHRLLHGFLPVSRFSASFYPELADRTHVIYGGVDVDRYRPSDVPRQERALFLGRLMPHKGIAELLQALPSDLPLHVVGRPYRPDYRTRLQELATDRQVTFDEGADDAQVLDELRSSRVLVLPSLDPADAVRPPKTELLGLTLLEAMACGTPVVCTRTGGMPEVVEGTAGGTAVAQRDPAALAAAIRHWVRDEDGDWEQASRSARAHVVDRFSWDAVARRALSAYGGPWAEAVA